MQKSKDETIVLTKVKRVVLKKPEKRKYSKLDLDGVKWVLNPRPINIST